jgi:hypothetical protein
MDPRTGKDASLFDPRRQQWTDHFRWGVRYERIVGRTPIGRATVGALDLNGTILRRARVMWVWLRLLPG